MAGTDPLTPPPEPPVDLLSPFERLSFRVMHGLSRHAMPITEAWLRRVTMSWMTLGSSRMMIPVGQERLRGLRPDDGILLVANHRTFSDLYMTTLLMRRITPLQQPVICPVRADFFYQQPLGAAVNLLVGGGHMYPPVFREPAKQAFNQWTLGRVAEMLHQGNVIIGFHPEGKRNTNADPYQPLPAQPGLGKLVMSCWPIVLPVFINGLTNNIAADIVGNFRGTRQVVVVYGQPVDLTPFRGYGDRLSSHKRIADALLKRVYELGQEERDYRRRVLGQG